MANQFEPHHLKFRKHLLTLLVPSLLDPWAIMSRSSASTSISASIKRIRSCPIHGVLPARRRVHSVLTPTAAKALIPSMEDLVLWKWDKITMAMSGGVDSAVALRILAEWVSFLLSYIRIYMSGSAHILAARHKRRLYAELGRSLV